MKKNYEPKKIEKKWQKYWLAKKIFVAKEKGPKKMVLIEFPYPSGAGLHMGHMRPFIAGDVVSKYWKLRGRNVMYPIGWDAFGLPAENYAIKNRVHPAVSTAKNIKNAKKQLLEWGTGFDWSREINTTDPNYYKWTQKIFLEFYKAGLAYEATGLINWCPQDKTGLANEEVVDGKCERCGAVVEKKSLRQWYLKITDYAEKLLEGLKDLPEWPEPVKIQQENWIGRSLGAEIDFKIIHPSPALPEGKGETPGYHSTDPGNYRLLHDKAVEMRKDPTEAEDKLWRSLKGNPNGYHFRKQHIIDKFIVDFTCLSKKLIIEVDGDIHDLQKERDEERTAVLEALGFKILRFRNDEVLQSTESVVKRIIDKLQTLNDVKVLPFGEDLGGVVSVFTTRADTLFGATYLVLAPEHPLAAEIGGGVLNSSEVLKYIEESKKKTDIDRGSESKEKTGVELKGAVAINPATGGEIPIWIADYVFASYGTGAVMAVPAHDQRDFEFANRYHLMSRIVINRNPGELSPKVMHEAYTESGYLKGSKQFDNLSSEEARKKITEFVGGRIVTRYKLRDWVFSRQRYWGEPIPLIHCEKCGIVPVPEKDLPVKLPKVKNYEPTGTGEGPLASVEKWVNTTCPTCGKKAKRETNTMPQWAGSSWYWLRYMDPKNKKEFANIEKQKYWNPVDFYFGGMEHTTLHLLYSRFWNLFLYDQKLVAVKEPYKKRVPHGIILAPDGDKMSKSKGNMVNPDYFVNLYGADTTRLYMMFLGPHEAQVAWNDKGIVGARRFLERVWNMQEFISKTEPKQVTTALHKMIKKVTEDLETFSFNTAVSAMMIFANTVYEAKLITLKSYQEFLKILSPFAPHISEELWLLFVNKRSIYKESWPEWNPELIKEKTVNIAVQVNGRVRLEIQVGSDSDDETVKAAALAHKKIADLVLNKTICKIIVVKNRLINIVI